MFNFNTDPTLKNEYLKSKQPDQFVKSHNEF